MVTDTCPCHYPNNYASNKRWCCGDMPHIDLSVWAYERVRMAPTSGCLHNVFPAGYRVIGTPR